MIITYTHILAGSIALICGLGALFFKKGSKQHILQGNLFYWSMLIIAFTGLYMSIIKTNWFLFHIAVFSCYQTISGKRAIRLKTSKVGLVDYLIVFISVINGLFMFSSLKVLLMFFGVISILLSINDFKYFYLKETHKPILATRHIIRHISHIVGAYIAAITAFLLNVKPLGNSTIVWLAPTLLITPIIIFYSRKFTTKKTLTS